MKTVETPITLEQYLHFYDDRWIAKLSRPHLNQIVAMHGFTKLRQEPKSIIMHYLETIDLAAPRRSTLEEGVSSCAFLTVAEAAEDIVTLGWQECPVRSVTTLKSQEEQDFLVANMTELPFFPSSAAAPVDSGRRLRGRKRRSSLRAPPPADFVIRGKRPRTKRRPVSVDALAAAPTATGTQRDAASSTSSSSPAVAKGSSDPPPPPLPSSSPAWTPPLPASPSPY